MPLHWQLLRYYIDQALQEQKDPYVALRIAQKLDAGDYRIITTFKVDPEGGLDPNSLMARVDVRCLDGWAELVSVHWTRLGLEWADVMNEAHNTIRQHAEGSYPGGPMDPRREPV